MQKKLVIVCLLNFFVAALMGLALRYFFVQPLPINFKFLPHAHSHVAMLGWVYLMLYIFIVENFIPNKKPIYNRLFWLTEIAVLGMMVSFPFQGYAAVSISFSTLHILCSYYFVWLVWKHQQTKSIASRRLLKAALICMLVSTLGVWCLGPAVGLYGQASDFYQIAIQFFLHFQFNSWFLFAVLAVFLLQFPQENIRCFKIFFRLLIISTILTFALPISWFVFHPLLLWINGVGVLLQFMAGFYFVLLLHPHWRNFWGRISTLTRWIFGLALISLVLKMLFQALSIMPEVAAMAYQYRNFVIGFIHLLMLGAISGFLLAFLLNSSVIVFKGTILKFGIYSFIVGFITTEVLLLGQGILYYLQLGMMPNYDLLLFICSILLPIGILSFILTLLKHDTQTSKTA